MKVSFGGIGECVATFYNKDANGAKPGDLVKISASGEVCPCSDSDLFAGYCISANDNFAAVQITGFITAPYSGSAPSLGRVTLAAANDNSVKSAAAGVPVLVIETDTSSKTVGFML